MNTNHRPQTTVGSTTLFTTIVMLVVAAILVGGAVLLAKSLLGSATDKINHTISTTN